MTTGNSPFRFISYLHTAVSATAWADYWSRRQRAAPQGLPPWCLHQLLNPASSISALLFSSRSLFCPHTFVHFQKVLWNIHTSSFCTQLQWALGVELWAKKPWLPSSWTWPYCIGYVLQSTLSFQICDNTISKTFTSPSVTGYLCWSSLLPKVQNAA